MHSLQELSDSNGRKNGENFDFQSYFRTANLFLEHEMFQVKMTPDKIDVSRSKGVNKKSRKLRYCNNNDKRLSLINGIRLTIAQ